MAANLEQLQDQPIDYYFLPNTAAARLSERGNPLIESLRVGHAILSPNQFTHELITGNFEVLALPNDCAALVTWGTYEGGQVLYILTVTCDYKFASHALTCIEAAARERKAQAIMSVGHRGWERLVKEHGFEVQRKLLMKKVLKYDTATES
jgi:hypothetical protein